MSKPFWMPLHIGAFQQDTIGLSAAEVGAYLTLLMIAWTRRDAGLPDDMVWLKRALKRYLGMHGREFNHVIPAILSRFFALEGGVWKNKRLTNEREIADKRVVNAKEKAAKRWSKTREINNIADATAYANTIQYNTIQKEESLEPKRATPAKNYFWEGEIIKLNKADYDRFYRQFEYLADLKAELSRHDAAFALEQAEGNDISRWWHKLRAMLAKDNSNEQRKSGVFKPIRGSII